MVASTNADIYSPFQQPMINEDGPQSSEEGSGLHSPVFGAPYPTHGDSFRYQDVHHSSGMIAPQYDYSINTQQPPILDTALELPSSSARQVTFPQYSLPPRNQLALDFPAHSPRVPAPAHAGPPLDFRYSERGPPSHEHSYIRPAPNSSAIPMEGDHRSSLAASSTRSDASPPADASTSARESRKEISSVVIACRQCRSRKIRCDSTRPVCNNCVRRSNECEYDLVPKRRGPDKRPGTRQRSCKKRPADGSAPPPSKRKRTTSERPTEQPEVTPSRVKENLQQDQKRPSPGSRHPDRDPHYPYLHPHSGPPPSSSPTDLRIPTDSTHYKHDVSSAYRRNPSYMYDQGSYTKSSYPRQLDVNTFQFPDTQQHRKLPIPTSASTEAEQKTWWDKILRVHTVQNTGHLLCFINLDFFIRRLHRDDERLHIQPAFMLSVLAMAKLMKSSSLEDGAMGLQGAMILANEAHAAFDDAIRLHWFDASLAEAGLILALFESSAYPQHSPSRATNALLNLDQLIKNIHLTTLDLGDRDVCVFSPNHVPVVLVDGGANDYNRDRKCACVPTDTLDPPNPYNNRPYHLPWDSSWSTDEIRDEETRRLCWSALTLVSEYIARCEAFNEEPPAFYLADPTNFGLLFPGEVLDRPAPSYRGSESLSRKESVWALYCRSMLLWNFCNRFRTPSEDEERAEQANEAFLEAQAIEDSLNLHTCNLDTTLIYNTREYVHNFHGLDNGKTSSGPKFKRKQAEDWLFYEDQIIQRVNSLMHQLNGPAGHQLTRRPYRINWFINQLAICLVLWNHDPTLYDALKLARNIFIPIDVLNALWPCPAIQQRCDDLRQQLIDACNSRNIELPLPPNYSVPSFLRT
ncbi:hypothetical protein M413DRAFT_17514 [Hebeloma cylindrosporum]|uniref:Zn(2)-C6 fungal-type domain-containing protein n=1 Tax=Hebeloma cylindrosporum TaxID=76867 RepID=A0A0C2YXR4_HEBCY|nr:hypothetical protein M413DRAFT_17514 [Hebeloma cylindrosporum h7]